MGAARAAGYLTLEGPFFAAHREEVLGFVMARVARARTEQPTHRVIGLRCGPRGTHVTIADAHLARDIAIALQAAFEGDMDLVYGGEENLIRATWSR